LLNVVTCLEKISAIKCGDLKVQVKQPVIGSALFLGRLNRSDGSVICRRLSFETASISCFAIPADEWPSIRKS
jgi:hypothetical protein